MPVAAFLAKIIDLQAQKGQLFYQQNGFIREQQRNWNLEQANYGKP